MNKGKTNKSRGLLTILNKASPWPMGYPFRMCREERKFFKTWIKPAKIYLEFGGGGSTIHAIKHSHAMVYSVESDQRWIKELVSYRILRKYLNKRWQYLYVNIGHTTSWGFPPKNASPDQFPAYSSLIFNKINPVIPDRILIDGRFRVACVLQSILHCHENPNLQILVHDIWPWKQYYVVLEFLNEIHWVDTLGVFSIRYNISLKKVERLYHEYKYRP